MVKNPEIFKKTWKSVCFLLVLTAALPHWDHLGIAKEVPAAQRKWPIHYAPGRAIWLTKTTQGNKKAGGLVFFRF